MTGQAIKQDIEQKFQKVGNLVGNTKSNSYLREIKVLNPNILTFRLLNFLRITFKLCRLKATWFLVILFLIGNVLTQTALSDPSNNEIEIESFSWFIGKDWEKISEFNQNNRNRLRFLSQQPNEIQSILTAEWKFIENQKEGFIYQLKLRNNSSKKIVSLTREYAFQNPQTGEILAKHLFTNQVKTKPKQVKNICVFSNNPPTGSISIDLLRQNPKKPYLENVAIKSLIFEGKTE